MDNDEFDYKGEFDKAIEEVYSWLLKAQQSEFDEFLNSNVLLYHNTLGRNIRNNFELWKRNYEPEIVDDVDVSPYHPDAISTYIMREVQKLAHERITSK